MVGKRRRTNGATIALAALLGLTVMAGTAVAGSQAVTPPTMPLGAAAPAPQGFIDLCRRDPDQCPATGPVPDLDQLEIESNRRRWSALFGVPLAPVAPPAAAPNRARILLSTAPITALVPRLTSRSEARFATAPTLAASPRMVASAAADAAREAAEASGDPLAVQAVAATDFASTAVAAPHAPAAGPMPSSDAVPVAPSTFTLDRQGWRTVNGINRRINRDIRHVDDRILHGQADRWALPVAAQGDCEDYVLAKRAALVEAGVPAEALSIAIVETPWGEIHAVLLLASDRGEYVLDNLSPWVSRWDSVSYGWRERQSRGGAFDWVNVAL